MLKIIDGNAYEVTVNNNGTRTTSYMSKEFKLSYTEDDGDLIIKYLNYKDELQDNINSNIEVYVNDNDPIITELINGGRVLDPAILIEGENHINVIDSNSIAQSIIFDYIK